MKAFFKIWTSYESPICGQKLLKLDSNGKDASNRYSVLFDLKWIKFEYTIIFTTNWASIKNLVFETYLSKKSKCRIIAEVTCFFDLNSDLNSWRILICALLSSFTILRFTFLSEFLIGKVDDFSYCQCISSQILSQIKD